MTTADDDEQPALAVSHAEAVAQPSDETLHVESNPLDEIDERFDLRPMRFGTGADGMPQHQVDDQPFIAPLSRETLVCLADTTKFVVKDNWGTVKAEFEPSEVEQTPSGLYRVTTEAYQARTGSSRLRAGQKPPEHGFTEVAPIRPVCQHYAAQLTESHILGAKREAWRLCTLRRDTAGAFMSVRDLLLSACTLRVPRDLGSEAQIATFDREKIEAGAVREYLPMFSELEPGQGVSDEPVEPPPPEPPPVPYFAPARRRPVPLVDIRPTDPSPLAAPPPPVPPTSSKE